MSGFYDTSPAGPRELAEYQGPHHGAIRPGDTVIYENPARRGPDGAYLTMGMDGTYTVTEIIMFDEAEPVFTTAVLDGGRYEVNADNLRKVDDA